MIEYNLHLRKKRGPLRSACASPDFIEAEQAVGSALGGGSPNDIWKMEYAGMVELVDSEDLGSSAERRVGSSPTTRTN